MPDPLFKRLVRTLGGQKAAEIYAKVYKNADALSSDPEIGRLLADNPEVHFLFSERDQVRTEARKLFTTGQFGIARHSTIKGRLETRTWVQRKREALRFLDKHLPGEDMGLVLLAYEIVYLERKNNEPGCPQEDRERLQSLLSRRDRPSHKDRARRIYNVVASGFLEEHIVPEMVIMESHETHGEGGCAGVFNGYLQRNRDVVWVNSQMSNERVESEIRSRLYDNIGGEIRVYCRQHNWERVRKVCHEITNRSESLLLEEVPDPQGQGGYLRITVSAGARVRRQ